MISWSWTIVHRFAAQISRNEFPYLITNDQNCFSTTEQTDAILEIIRSVDKDVANRLHQRWTHPPKNPEEKWDDLRREANQERTRMRKERARDQNVTEEQVNVELDDIVSLSFSQVYESFRQNLLQAAVPGAGRYYASIHLPSSGCGGCLRCLSASTPQRAVFAFLSTLVMSIPLILMVFLRSDSSYVNWMHLRKMQT